MGFQNFTNDNAIGNGGAGSPGVWDIIDDSNYDLGGRLVSAFMSLDEEGGEMEEMEEETTIGRGGKPGVVTQVDAKYLNYVYPYSVPFEGRYAKLVPASGSTFKVWFLK